MLDPFPPAPTLLRSLASPLIEKLGLATLEYHIHEVLFAAVLYQTIFLYISPSVCPYLFPKHYPQFSNRNKVNWDIHMVSFVQSVIINTLALYTIWTDDERWNMDWRGRIWGYTGGQGMVQAFATGYFLWDAYICTRYLHFFGPGMLAHGYSALFVFGNGFRPFVNYYGPVFILYELSSPFLNIHWCLDKLAMTGSTPQLINGIVLMASFFACRLCWGSYQTVRVFSDIWKALQYQDTAAGKLFLASTNRNLTAGLQEAVGLEETSQVFRYAGGKYVPLWLGAGYLISNAILNVLNVFWFGRMVSTIRKRFEPPFGTKKRSEKEVEIVRGVDADGRRSVEVDAAETRRRKVRRA